jgi:predicted dehydrogenase
MKPSRRGFMQASAASVAGGYLLSSGTSTSMAAGYRSALEQPVVGFIGTGIRFHTYLGKAALEYGPCASLADVDSLQAGRALQVVMDQHRAKNLPLDMRAHEDYRKVLDNKDIDAVVIGTVDHWHSKIAIEAMLAGKDVYCEKPLTLTIREGQQILQVLEKTKSVFQVGTQQRSEFEHRFVKAAAMLRENRIGKVKRLTVALGPSRECDALPAVDPPKSLNWDMWQGQCAVKQYREAPTMTDVTGWGAGHNFGRGHRYYRWFYEYSGGKLTDWGAHHVDIAMWAMDKLGEDAGKVSIKPISSYHPVKLDEKGMPTEEDRFNCAVNFQVLLTFDDGIEMLVCDKAEGKGFDNGIMFEGEKGRYFVNRGKLTGRPVEDLAKKPLDEGKMRALYASEDVPMGKNDKNDGANMKCFFDCIKSRKTPSSDVRTHHKAMNICHAINVALRLNREVVFDTKAEDFGDDALANSFVEREQRKGFEINVG